MPGAWSSCQAKYLISRKQSSARLKQGLKRHTATHVTGLHLPILGIHTQLRRVPGLRCGQRHRVHGEGDDEDALAQGCGFCRHIELHRRVDSAGARIDDGLP